MTGDAMSGILGQARTYSSALGASNLLAGTFVFDARSRVMTWSDELYSIHGYRRGDVVPTMELTMAHKHPDDLPRIQEVSNELFAGRAAALRRGDEPVDLVDGQRRHPSG